MIEPIKKEDLVYYVDKPVYVMSLVKPVYGEWCIGIWIKTEDGEEWFEAHNVDCSVYRDNYGIDWEAYEMFPQTDMGEVSDGYHTFNELYHHRAILFSVICSKFKSLAWKSKKHDDGTMFDGMFIVGINTPKGQATYHYDIEPYWEMFDVEELEYAPKFDGHTPDEAIDRIYSLAN